MKAKADGTKEAAKEDGDDEFETNWRCWICKRIYPMESICKVDNLSVSDFPDND